jgi:hypothetical protein
MKRLIIGLILSLISTLSVATPTCVIGTAGATPVMTLTFTPPTTNADGTPLTLPITYSVYQGTTSGGEVKVGSGLSGSPITLNTGLVIGSTYYVYLEVVDTNGSSVASTEVCKTFPASTAVPSPVTNLVAS